MTPLLTPELKTRIDNIIKQNKIVVFMKGLMVSYIIGMLHRILVMFALQVGMFQRKMNG